MQAETTTIDERIGEDRRHMFENYANGVDIEDMKEPFKRSATEIERDIFFVAKKIKEYRMRRITTIAPGGQKSGSWENPGASPPVACDTLIDIRVNRLSLLDTLRRLGNRYLSSALLLPKVSIQKVSHPSEMREAMHRVNTSKALS